MSDFYYPNYEEFNKDKSNCRSCDIFDYYKKVILSDGNRVNPNLLIIGECPGSDEIEQGKPFVGKCGKYLRKTLKEFGIDESNALITNTIPCRPLDNKFPKDYKKIHECVRRWLRKEISLIEPEFILTLGFNAFSHSELCLKFSYFSKEITKSSDFTMSKIRGNMYSYPSGLYWREKALHIMPTFHPAYVMRKMYSKTSNIVELFRQDIQEIAKKCLGQQK